MTRQERMKAFEMRLDGKSWDDIAAVLGYTTNNVRIDIIHCIRYTPRQITCVYPAIRQYITANCYGSAHQFARDCGVPYSTMGNILNGRHTPSLETATAILQATGLSVDEAFRQEED